MMSLRDAGTSGTSLDCFKNCRFGLAIVFPPPELEVPEPVRTTRFSMRSHSEMSAWRPDPALPLVKTE